MEPDPDVLEMVREQLDRDSPPSTEALYGRAASINSDIYELTLRQFNATYVLRVKRERKRSEQEGGPGGGDGRGEAGGSGGQAAPTQESEEVEPRPGGFLDALRDEEDEGGAADDNTPAASEAAAAPSTGGPEGTEERDARSGLRARVRSILWRFARRVAARPGMAGALEAVETVDEPVEEILGLAGGGAGAASDA